MAKAKTRGQPTSAAPPTAAEVAEATRIAGCKRFFDLGARVKAAMEGGLGRKPASRAVAAETGQAATLARKASFFVERYTASEIARLEGSRTSEGKPICLSMLTTLAMVGRADRRRDLLLAIELGRHTTASLAEAVRKMPKEGASQGGPHRRLPNNRMDGLAQICKASRDWLDRDARVWRSGPWREVAVPEADAAAVDRATDEVCALLTHLAEAALVLRGTLAVPAKKAGRGRAPGAARAKREKRSS